MLFIAFYLHLQLFCCLFCGLLGDSFVGVLLVVCGCLGDLNLVARVCFVGLS